MGVPHLKIFVQIWGRIMCIVADTVEDVFSTRIASFYVVYTLVKGKTIVSAQLVVYSANVNSPVSTNAFILPIYNPGNDYRKIIPLAMSNLPDFLNNISKIYERWYPKYKTYSLNNATLGMENDNGTLPVYIVGDYRFGIMQTKADFYRLDRSQLNVDPASKASIDIHSNDYTFIVYQFYQRSKLKITPFGYLCQPIKNDQIIIPTIHGHPHESLAAEFNFPDSYITFSPIYQSSGFESYAHYDHEIFTMVKGPNTKRFE